MYIYIYTHIYIYALYTNPHAYEHMHIHIHSPEQLDWNATIPGSTKRVGQRFKEMQRDVHNITYLVQRLHIELSVYFFISSSAKDTNADDDETAANKPVNLCVCVTYRVAKTHRMP